MLKEKRFLWLIFGSLLGLIVFNGLIFFDKRAYKEEVLGDTSDCSSNCSWAKEIYIPLGQGSTDSQQWVEIPGAEAVIDEGNFSGIKSIILEASLRVPTGNSRVHVKLFNVTEKHDVWFSEVWVEGLQSKREESKPISLGLGRKLYRIMMKSTMGREVILDQARLKIVLE